MSERLYHLAGAAFEAARRVDHLPQGHRSRRLHGHSFLTRVFARSVEGWSHQSETLVEALNRCVAPLNYASLNDHLPVPTDENLARWLRRTLDIPGIDTVGIQSTRDQGADLDAVGHVHVWRRFRFEAAHRLPNVPAGHKCGRMHGHGFEVILHADQDLGQRDMEVDFDYLEACWTPLQAELNYACLNDIPGLENPTSERLADWVWRRLEPRLPELSWVTVYETATAGCHYDGLHYRIWKEQRFESALRLARVSEGDPRRHLHGHSYLIRLHLSAPLDAVMGWTVDYGDVKDRFKPVYQRLDHHLLNDVPDLTDADPASLARWIRGQMGEALPQLDRIDLYETLGCGVVLAWGEHSPALPG